MLGRVQKAEQGGVQLQKEHVLARRVGNTTHTFPLKEAYLPHGPSARAVSLALVGLMSYSPQLSPTAGESAQSCPISTQNHEGEALHQLPVKIVVCYLPTTQAAKKKHRIWSLADRRGVLILPYHLLAV